MALQHNNRLHQMLEHSNVFSNFDWMRFMSRLLIDEGMLYVSYFPAIFNIVLDLSIKWNELQT